MTSCRSVVSTSAFIALCVLGLSACGGEKPSGLAPFTPPASNGSSSPTSRSADSPERTGTSKWTVEQQRVIEGYGRFTDFTTSIWAKDVKIDMAKARRVAKEPFATVVMKSIDGTLSAGYIRTGKVVNTISTVTVAGDKATLETCLDQSQTKYSNPGNASAPSVQMLPPARGTVSLVREANSWLVADYKIGKGACVSG
jgi:hypothetical protein